MATFEKSGLSCAKFAQCVKLEGVTRVNWFSGWAWNAVMIRAGQACLAGSIRSRFLVSVKGEACVGFRVEERVVRVHSVDFARREISPLVAFVSRQEWPEGALV